MSALDLAGYALAALADAGLVAGVALAAAGFAASVWIHEMMQGED